MSLDPNSKEASEAMIHLRIAVFSVLFVTLTRLAAAAPTLHSAGQPLPFAHQGPFVTTGDGGVLCVDAQHALVSHDEGRTWQQHPLFKDPQKYEVSNERALLRTHDAVVIAAWMNLKEKHNAEGFRWGGDESQFRQFILPTYVCRSLDDGATWEEPIKLNTPWCGCIHSMIETHDGRIVLVGQEIIPQWRHATVVFVSTDRGKTWKRSNVLDIGQGRHDHAGSIEGTIVERKDHSIYQLLRTETGTLYQAVSRDGGLTWNDFRSSGIPSVTCCAQLGRLADGRIALLWNRPPRLEPANRRNREELSIAFSSDECKTWSDPVIVATNYVRSGRGAGSGRVSYPYIYERRPGELWITTMQGGLRMKIDAARLASAAAPMRAAIVMFGDSTTAARPGAVDKVYARRVQEALSAAGDKDEIAVINAGVAGDTTEEARARFRQHVLDLHPRLVVIQFGLNDSAIDVWKNPPATAPRVSLDRYGENLRWMIDAARKNGVKVVLMTTNPVRWTAKLKQLYGKPPYDPADAEGFDRPQLLAYNDAVRKIAREVDAPLVDVYAAYHEWEKTSGRPMGALLADGMHPNDDGHKLVAKMLLSVVKNQLR
jgi:sialidase-1